MLFGLRRWPFDSDFGLLVSGFRYNSRMSETPHSLEYAFPLPVQPIDDWRTTLSRLLALGYVAACVLALLLMGIFMALQV